MLRWATLLKIALMRSQLPLLVSTMESVLGTALELAPLGAAKMREMVGAGIAALSEGVNQFESAKGGRLAAPAGLAVNRAVTRVARSLRRVLSSSWRGMSASTSLRPA